MEVIIREMQFCVNLILKENLKVTTNSNTIYLLVINCSVTFLINDLVSVH